MGRISVLSKQLANMIAAGEVVERPASVVKELVENSIDAGATDITVEIKNGGNTYIRVTDNGCGMSLEDATLAFARHATSKIKNEEDLFEISTMGFRGEALAAISAVSTVELVTRERGSEDAHLVSVTGGEVSAPEEVGAPEGTTIVVKDLFFNTPARKKFLKKDITEAAVIISSVEKIALAMPDIAFTLIKDGRISLQTDGRGIKSAVESIFTVDTYRYLLPLEYELNGVSVYGYIGKPEIARQNRNSQYFSINGRVIRSRVFQTAVEESMKNRLMSRSYPVCIVNVSVDFSKVDVNVHPSKLEVKLASERAVYDAIYFAAMNAFEADNIVKDIKPSPVTKAFLRYEEEPEPMKQTVLRAPSEPLDLSAWGYTNVTMPKTEEKPTLSAPTAEEIDLLIQKAISARAPQPDEQSELEEHQDAEDFRYVGEIFKTYLILEKEEEILLIDKHAAQERILFEKLKSKQGTPDCQGLLTPVMFSGTNEEYAALLENIEDVRALGFDIDDFGTGSIAIRGVPADLAQADPQALLGEVVTAILQNKRDKRPERYDELLHSMACKAAIKGGQHNSPQELEAFARKLMSMPEIRYCPHGRPVMISLTKSYLEGQFKR